MSALFIDSKKQRHFDRLGFVSFPLLDSRCADDLRRTCISLTERHGQPSVTFRSTSGSGDRELITEADLQIDRAVTSHLPEHFSDYNLLGYNFLIKDSGESSAVPAHQDWTYVDESRFASLNIWVALHDVSEREGCLWFAPRSHRIASFLRPAPDYPWPFAGVADTLTAMKVAVPLKAGECVCFNNGVVHGSYPNISGRQRFSAVGTVYPQAAALQHYFQRPSQPTGRLWKFHLDAKTFLNLHRGSAPASYISKEEVSTFFPVIDRTQLVGRLIGLRISDLWG
ncbi:MAG: phytanoyl-CoA dioxygenase family protein [Flavobacteriales bacterium]|nr:phytanoyl-CoA dioxygenase family protein [Flavobacteriales bacterium]